MADQFSDEGHRLFLPVDEEVDFDDGIGLVVSEQVTAGQDIGLSDFAADDRSRSQVRAEARCVTEMRTLAVMGVALMNFGSCRSVDLGASSVASGSDSSWSGYSC
ncbi:MAG: hypothetical protein U0903_10625 [Planctomycetales bacterium]